MVNCVVSQQILQSYVVDIDPQLEPFDVPLSDLEKDVEPTTTLSEQCSRFLNHYRQIAFWKYSGLPIGAQKALTKCYTHCKETDPVCVNACECLHLQWVMNYECFPGIRAPAGPNCQRNVMLSIVLSLEEKKLMTSTIAGNYRTFNRPRQHGVSFYRGTNTVLVDWPEGKISSASTVDVPAVGVNVIYNAVDIGFPNPRRTLHDLTKDNPDPLNPGTGRKKSAVSMMRRT
ncbi:hypothetical protein DICVIV_03288 [Dictyocaulus viviparus]|uniref:Uncharacterized protein n=1 Tax=Dictyocaulus viviparus TaxID=29172 RepID=A0A0D8Y3C0_DICVI|nr:hypothetical protein DICVIV_03288 [Dictyocaulus viviparus]